MRRIVPALAAVIAAGSLAGGLTLTSASASPAAATAAAAPAAAPAASSTEHFRIITASSTSRHLSIIATGHFTAGGDDVPGRVESGHATDKFIFPSGRFQVHRHVTHESVSLPKDCLFTEVQRGTYTLGQGTGQFRRISGSGSFALRITGVIRRSKGVCSASGKMSAFQQITYASGHVRG